jgi:hypothetical protein
MPSQTNLQYVQKILSALDSDEVSSVSDTVESEQVLKCVERAYDAIVTRADLHEHYSLFELDASGDSDYPTVMFRPDNVSSIEWVKYNKNTDDDETVSFQNVTFLPLDQFLNMMYSLNTDDDNVETAEYVSGTDTITLVYRNDQAPTYFTTYDDHTLLFDSYDNEVDTTLQNDKSLAYGKKDQSFTLTDSFVPFIDREFSALLLNEAMVLAFMELKQVGHQKANEWANRLWTKTSHAKRGVDSQHRPMDDLPHYGRK